MRDNRSATGIPDNTTLRNGLNELLEKRSEEEKTAFKKLIASLDAFNQAIWERDKSPTTLNALPEHASANQIAEDEANRKLVEQEHATRHQLYRDSLLLTQTLLKEKSPTTEEITLLKQTVDFAASKLVSKQTITPEESKEFEGIGQKISTFLETRPMGSSAFKKHIWGGILIGLGVLVMLGSMIGGLTTAAVSGGTAAAIGGGVAIGGLIAGVMLISLGIDLMGAAASAMGKEKRSHFLSSHLSLHQQIKDQLPKEEIKDQLPKEVDKPDSSSTDQPGKKT